MGWLAQMRRMAHRWVCWTASSATTRQTASWAMRLTPDTPNRLWKSWTWPTQRLWQRPQRNNAKRTFWTLRTCRCWVQRKPPSTEVWWWGRPTWALTEQTSPRRSRALQDTWKPQPPIPGEDWKGWEDIFWETREFVKFSDRNECSQRSGSFVTQTMLGTWLLAKVPPDLWSCLVTTTSSAAARCNRQSLCRVENPSITLWWKPHKLVSEYPHSWLNGRFLWSWFFWVIPVRLVEWFRERVLDGPVTYRHDTCGSKNGSV